MGKGHTLTALEALKMMGVFRLAARIEDLRRKGHNIVTEEVQEGGKTFRPLSSSERSMDMAYERPPGTGALFGQSKPDGGKGPDWKGELLLDQDYKKGDTLKMAGWIKQTARGPLISIKEDTWKPDPNYKQNQQPTPSRNFDDLDSDVPF
jgi:hypothetical protein